MKIDSLKTEAKRLGLRVTKKIRGKRIPLTEKELRMKIQRRQAPALEIQVRETKKLLRTCKSLFKEMSSGSTPRVSKPVTPPSLPKPKSKPPIPPAPPVPPKRVPPAPPVPTKRDPRANLMTALKANLKRRGIKQKLNQIS
tara:strand:+ start:3722 stop:4144 length:423 start_codon:yes stop_codon:yes gene_type:complete